MFKKVEAVAFGGLIGERGDSQRIPGLKRPEELLSASGSSEPVGVCRLGAGVRGRGQLAVHCGPYRHALGGSCRQPDIEWRREALTGGDSSPRV